jgi:hypothetical protein
LWWIVLTKSINTKCPSSSSAVKPLCIKSFMSLFVLWQRKNRTTMCEF